LSEKPIIIDSHALLGDEYPFSMSAAQLLEKMDAQGIAMAVARPVGAELVVHNRAGNDRVLSASPRIKAWVSVNPWCGASALDEMRRCRDAGAVGLFLHPSRQGFMPIEPVAKPVLELAESFRWPIMFHTGSYVQSDVLAVGEVARRMPGTKFVMGFAGYTDMWFELPGVFEEVSNLWLDASMIWSAAVAQIVADHGFDRVLFGGAEPRNRYEVVLRALERQQLGAHAMRAILGGNAVRLFGIEAHAGRPA
jgi:predicted TIM-barrel fold metal-dependent hydrolase